VRGGLFERRVEKDVKGVAFDPHRRPTSIGQTLDLGFGFGRKTGQDDFAPRRRAEQNRVQSSGAIGLSSGAIRR